MTAAVSTLTGEGEEQGALGNARPFQLPAPLSSLIDREHELDTIQRLLLDPQVRLLTLTGAPGAGKSRLALACAEALQPAFPDGVWFIPLAPLQRADLVVPTVARFLGLRPAGKRAPLEALTRVLRNRRVLLVLDNFEHLLAAGPAVVELLAACRRVTALVTSRAPLQVSGERRLEVPPLALPSLRPLPVVQDLAHVPSVRLLVERTTAVAPGFSLSPANAAAVAELCVRLDGLPLAIELAAARCRLLSPAELLARLDHRLALLGDGPRDAAPRQRGLRAAISWSYGLLSPDEQRLFRCLGVFAGGCTLEAAEAVVRDPDEAPLDALEGITRLVDHSLLRREPDPEGCLRVGMLETIRAFALEQLADAGELETIRRRHAAFFAHLAERAASPRLDGPDGPALLDRLELEHDNMRLALRWLLDSGGGEAAVQVSGALWSFWEMRGHVGEGLAWLDAALADGHTASPAARARALIGTAAMYRARGEYAAAAPRARESATIRRALGDAAGLAESLLVLSDILTLAGDPAEASALAAEALAIRQQRSDAVGMAWVMMLFGNRLMFQGDFAGARVQFERALALRGGERDNVVDAWILRGLGAVLGGSDADTVTARALLEQALDLFRARGDLVGMSGSLLALGDLALRGGDRDAGHACLAEAEAQLARAALPPVLPVAILSGRPVPAHALDEVTGAVIVAGWRWTLGRDLPPSVARRMRAATGDTTSPSVIERAPVADGLTPREREVLMLLARHYTNREIAEELVLSTRTVERHVANIFSKLGVSSRRQAGAYGRERGLLNAEVLGRIGPCIVPPAGMGSRHTHAGSIVSLGSR